MIYVIWQPQHKGFSASHWHTGTSVADDARRLDCAKSSLEVQIRIPGGDRVRSPWCVEGLRQFSRCLCTSASCSRRLNVICTPASRTFACRCHLVPPAQNRMSECAALAPALARLTVILQRSICLRRRAVKKYIGVTIRKDANRWLDVLLRGVKLDAHDLYNGVQ